ncbi:hypothetical protein ALC53_03555 [Atta colombica]|uniref:Uncharacterized protein n=1 Tax=Atta colombica TaxID=520822 RepID=A0A195BN04_9HYME|nr:hypothetical protein ALC53_03555 [Atta colombica]
MGSGNLMHDARENEGGGEGCHVSARRPASTQTDTVPTSRVMCPANPFDDFGNSGASASCSFFHLLTRSRDHRSPEIRFIVIGVKLNVFVRHEEEESPFAVLTCTDVPN